MPRLIFKGDNLTNGNKVFSFIPPLPQIDDWFLPSQDELSSIVTNLYDEGVGNFLDSGYWSSSESDKDNAIQIYFPFAAIQNNPKGSTMRIRAIRTFTAASGQYSLRDVGPSGGLIFYIDETTYYEAAENDITGTYTWSNVTDVAVTGTNTAIGTGLSNTLAIVGQVDHTASAAQICLDYVV